MKYKFRLVKVPEQGTDVNGKEFSSFYYGFGVVIYKSGGSGCLIEEDDEQTGRLNMLLSGCSKKDFEETYEEACDKGFPADNETRLVTMNDEQLYHWYSDKVHVWDSRDEEGDYDMDSPEVPDKGAWFSNDDVFKIARRFYQIQESGSSKNGYPVTDEIFDSEAEEKVDYKGDLIDEGVW